MKLTFFGTSHGVPEPHRHCSCTLIETGGNCYFIDMGMMALDELGNRGIAVDRVKAVFVTHMHGDHADGLVEFVDLLSWYYKTANPQIFLPDPQAASILSDWLVCLGTQLRPEIGFGKVEAGMLHDDGVLKVTAVKTAHTGNSYAYYVQADGKSVLFTGDLAAPAKDFPKIAFEQPTDLILCEGAHFPAVDYLPVFAKSKARRFYFNHYAPWNIPNILQVKQEMPDSEIVLATDGLTVEI